MSSFACCYLKDSKNEYVTIHISPFTLLLTSPLFVHSLHIRHPHAEDEEILLSSLFCHLHIGTIHGADGEGTIQHELHVTSARGLSARCGDLLGQVGSGDD